VEGSQARSRRVHLVVEVVRSVQARRSVVVLVGVVVEGDVSCSERRMAGSLLLRDLVEDSLL
jgi:hypothetical protein